MVDIIDNILKSSHDINSPDNDGNLLLHVLVTYNKKEQIVELLKHNPIIFYKNKDGESPICIAKRLKYDDIYEILTKYCDENNIEYTSISNSSSSNNLSNESYSNESEYSSYSSGSSSICSSSSELSSENSSYELK
tara:strand:+ start:196 stop:603 length:408 start_codon:yes stop_codon:yes gene_type:complete